MTKSGQHSMDSIAEAATGLRRDYSDFRSSLPPSLQVLDPPSEPCSSSSSASSSRTTQTTSTTTTSPLSDGGRNSGDNGGVLGGGNDDDDSENNRGWRSMPPQPPLKRARVEQDQLLLPPLSCFSSTDAESAAVAAQVHLVLDFGEMMLSRAICSLVKRAAGTTRPTTVNSSSTSSNNAKAKKTNNSEKGKKSDDTAAALDASQHLGIRVGAAQHAARVALALLRTHGRVSFARPFRGQNFAVFCLLAAATSLLDYLDGLSNSSSTTLLVAGSGKAGITGFNTDGGGGGSNSNHHGCNDSDVVEATIITNRREQVLGSLREVLLTLEEIVVDSGRPWMLYACSHSPMSFFLLIFIIIGTDHI
jgi:hypothetical protein